MAYNEKLANRIREQLADLPNVEEKEMMGGAKASKKNRKP